MLIMQQPVHRPLECVWTLSNNRLTCAWVPAGRAANADSRSQESAAAQRRVA
jgi:hypothetical protein